MKTWESIFQEVPWVDKEFFKKENFDLYDLLKLNGHISDTGAYNVKMWNDLISEIKKYASLNRTSKILEIGCGAGALLWYLKEFNIYGIDRSEKLLGIAKKVMKNGEFHITEATTIPFEDSYFDVVLSHSCFHFFPDKNYMSDVIVEVIRTLKKGGRLILTDLLDKSKEQEFKNTRITKLGKKEYDRLYGGEKNKNLKHLYVTKKYMNELLNESFDNIFFTKACRRGGENDDYKFNLFCRRK
jgi:ubiquinone/menaquinone biosynthesis C-methylase UbiE